MILENEFVTPCLVVAVQPWMEWIAIKKNDGRWNRRDEAANQRCSEK